MECERCGRWAPADVETGYDADTVCPDCAALDDPDEDHAPGPADAMDPAALAEQVILGALETIRQQAEQADTVSRGLDLARLGLDLERAVQATQDLILARCDALGLTQ